MNVATECSKSLLFRNLYTERLDRNIIVSKSVSKADQTSHLKLSMEGQKETNLPIAPIKHIMNKMQNRSNISLSSFRSSVLRFDGTFMEFIITCKHAANSYNKRNQSINKECTNTIDRCDACKQNHMSMIWQLGFWKPGECKNTLHVVQKILTRVHSYSNTYTQWDIIVVAHDMGIVSSDNKFLRKILK